MDHKFQNVALTAYLTEQADISFASIHQGNVIVDSSTEKMFLNVHYITIAPVYRFRDDEEERAKYGSCGTRRQMLSMALKVFTSVCPWLKLAGRYRQVPPRHSSRLRKRSQSRVQSKKRWRHLVNRAPNRKFVLREQWGEEKEAVELAFDAPVRRA